MTANEFRFSGAVDHIAIRCEDLDRAVAGYAQLGFSVETIYDDWALMRDRNGFGIALRIHAAAGVHDRIVFKGAHNEDETVHLRELIQQLTRDAAFGGTSFQSRNIRVGHFGIDRFLGVEHG